LSLLVFPASSVRAESCLAAGDLDSSTRTALTAAALRYFDLVEKGDYGLAPPGSGCPAVASDFSVIETTVIDNKAALAGAKAALRPAFLLVAEGNRIHRGAEFYCGVLEVRARPA